MPFEPGLARSNLVSILGAVKVEERGMFDFDDEDEDDDDIFRKALKKI